MFYYKAPDGNSKFASVNCYNFETVNCQARFREAIFREDDDHLYIFCYLETIDNIKNSKDGSWKFEPQPCMFKVAKKPFKQIDFKTKQEVEIKDTTIEKMIVAVVNELDKNSTYTGSIFFLNGSFADNAYQNFLSAPNKSELILQGGLAQFINLRKLQSSEFIKPEDCVIPKGNRQGGGFQSKISFEAEADELSARVAFVIDQFNRSGAEIKNLADVASIISNPNVLTLHAQLYECCIDLIHGRK